MLEFLSDKSWLAPQLNFLLHLQSVRVNCPDIINDTLKFITTIGESFIPMLICSIYYWCINKKDGIFLFSLFGFQYIFSQLFKMLACVYRPWILDGNIQPPESVRIHAGGYSFPSGHSSMISSNLGGVIAIVKNNLFRILLAAIILTVGFSRMWFGVHTPQDVIVGLSIGIVLIFLIRPLINYAEKNKNMYIYLLVAANIFAIFSLIYLIYFCKYPMDYDSGKLIVDPKHSLYVVLTYYGLSLGIINGICLCTRFFPFDPQKIDLKSKILRGLIGGSMLAVTHYMFFEKYIIKSLVDVKIAFIYTFLAGLFVTLIYPVICSKIKLLNK